MIAKYFATSLAIENVVNAPRVIRSCFPISTTSISLVGSLSRSTMFAASFGGLRAGVHGERDIGLRERWRIVGAVAHHRHQLAHRLLFADVVELRLGRCLGEKIVHAGLRGNRGGASADCRR